MLPETLLQFGAGNFLRAFADVFVHECNQTDQKVGHIVVVQSTNSNRAQLLNDQQGHYHVLTQGIEQGQRVDRTLKVESISRALVAQTDWEQIRQIAQSPALRYIISNVTEAGLALDPKDQDNTHVPLSFPAKLLQVLHARYEAQQSGLTILPCELVEQNADLLLKLVQEQAQKWQFNADFQNWITKENTWCNTLVDRIVSGRPDGHPLRDQDQLLTAAEPFAQWVIETPHTSDPLFAHPAIIITQDVTPYTLRKVRILNGAHTALVAHALPMGMQTVREAVENKKINTWLKQLLFEEICPVVASRVEQAEIFAHQVLERFANPFLNHKLADIALHHETKIQTRLMPTYREYKAQFGKAPSLLSEIVAEHL